MIKREPKIMSRKNLSDFGVRVDELRVGKKLTVENVASRLGVTVKTFKSWLSAESTENTMPLRSLLELCDILECDVDRLLGKIDEKTHDNHFICSKTGLTEAAVEKLENSFSRHRQMMEFVPYVDKLESYETAYLGEDLNNSLMNVFIVNSILEDETIIKDMFDYVITDKIETVSSTYDRKVMAAVTKYKMKRDKYIIENRIEDCPDFSDLKAWADREEQKAIINFCNRHNIAIPDEDAIWYICLHGMKVDEEGNISINSNVDIGIDVVKQALLRRVQDGLDRIKKRDLLQRIEVTKKN